MTSARAWRRAMPGVAPVVTRQRSVNWFGRMSSRAAMTPSLFHGCGPHRAAEHSISLVHENTPVAGRMQYLEATRSARSR